LQVKSTVPLYWELTSTTALRFKILCGSSTGGRAGWKC
jgi:hypothetical protein